MQLIRNEWNSEWNPGTGMPNTIWPVSIQEYSHAFYVSRQDYINIYEIGNIDIDQPVSKHFLSDDEKSKICKMTCSCYMTSLTSLSYIHHNWHGKIRMHSLF